jgi:Ankyrin repeats (3 copies)
MSKVPPKISRKRSICDISTTKNINVIPVENRCVRIISRPSLPKTIVEPVTKPLVYLKSHLLSLGVDIKLQSCRHLAEFFLDPQQSEIDAYGFDLLNAVRNQDLKALEKFYNEGRPLKCSNQFGESLLHLACRKSFTKVVRFLIETANVPLNVKDDFGRNPAHDACWTISPNWELMDLIVDECPDLFYIEDVRGHTALDYIRMEHWPAWNNYIRMKGVRLTPKRIPFIKCDKIFSEPVNDSNEN